MAGAEYTDWRDRLAKGLDQSLFPLGHLDDLLISGAAFFMGSDRGAIVFEFKRFPSGVLAVNGLLAAGDAETIRNELIPMAIKAGKAAGCSKALIESRPGWSRLLKNDGFEVFQVSVVKDI